MAKVSRNALSKDMEAVIWKTLLDTFREARTSEEVGILLNDLFTSTEKIMFSKRLAIAYFLREGKTYEEISKKLKVSFATIGTVRNTKLRDGRGYSVILDAIAKKLK